MLGEGWRRVWRRGRTVMRQDNQAALDAAFRLSLDLASVSEHQGWRTARDQVLAALAAGPGLVALLGPAGTGKTLLLSELARALRAAGRETELVGRGDLHFNAGTDAVVLVDEAARTEEATLSSLALPGVTAVLADLPGLETRLASLGAAVTVVRLEPLRPDEIGAFVADRLARAGQPTDLLTADAVEAIAVHSAGVPRVLNLLARAALFMAETDAAARVEGRHVSLAVALRDGETSDMDAEIPALSNTPDIRAQFNPAPDSAFSEAGAFATPTMVAQLRAVLEAEALPAGPSVHVAAPAEHEAVSSEAPEQPAPAARSRIRTIRQGAAVLVASALVIASLIAGWSHGPYLAAKVRSVLARATVAASSMAELPRPSTEAGRSP